MYIIPVCTIKHLPTEVLNHVIKHTFKAKPLGDYLKSRIFTVCFS